MTSSKSHVIGIDLGTTFSVVATINEYGKPVVLKNAEGSTITPSVIAFDADGNIVIGDEAKSIQGLGDASIASFFKRSMGSSSFFLEFFGKRYSAADLSALVLKKLKADAEAALGEKITQAVITVPAYFNNFQRETTVAAGKQAGLDVLRVINEPTAAAIAFGIDKSKDQTLLVYDLGGGTFDVTLMKITADEIEVLATDGDHELGGKDWDDRIRNFAVEQFQNEFGSNPLDDVIAMNDLLVAGENAKKALTPATKTNISIVFDGNKGRYTLTREQFNEMTIDLVQRTITLCENVIDEKKLEWKDIDGILLVGGSTRMPMIEEAVVKLSGKPAIHGINVDEAVAIGAAIQAVLDKEDDEPKYILETTQGGYQLAGRKKIQDVTGQSLGMIAENADRSKYINSIIIPRNTKIPSCEVRPYQFRTSAKKDNELEVYVTQGENEYPGDCSILGKYVFSNIKHEQDGNAVLEIEYRYDRSGIVEVSGKQRSAGKKLSVRKESVPNGMSWIDVSPKSRGGSISEHVTVIIAVDCSGSMIGKPIKKAQEAAREFLHKIDLTHFSLGIMAVADRVKMVLEPSQDAKKIEKIIDEMRGRFNVGSCNAAQPFTEALQYFENVEGTKFMIVLADGSWEHQKYAIQEAKKCHAANIGVAALGFGYADKKFLKNIASCDENAMFTDMNRIGESFSSIAQVLTEGKKLLNVQD